MIESDWKEVSKDSPCEVCGKPDWCGRSPDGVIISCRRKQSGSYKSGLDKNGSTFYLHRVISTPRRCRPQSSQCKIPPEANASRASCNTTSDSSSDLDLFNRGYSRLLDLLTLSDDHRRDLCERGFTDDVIDLAAFRSLPANATDIASLMLGELKRDLYRIPGFTKEPKLCIRAGAGLLIPVRDLQGRIIAMRVRSDNPESGKKYYWLSSGKDGPGPGSPAHVPLGISGQCDTVRITEGELKAELSFSLSGIPTISFPGVGQWRQAYAIAKELGAKEIRIAFDADAKRNEHVARNLVECVRSAIADGLTAAFETWDEKDGKGIDDLLAGGKAPRVIYGDEAISEAESIFRAAKAAKEEKAASSYRLAPETIVKALDRNNFGRVVEDHGDSCLVRFVSDDGVESTVELQKSELRNQDGSPLPGQAILFPPELSADELIESFPSLNPPVIDGLLRTGETMNIIAAPKTGKSWLSMGLAMCVATGRPWFDKFPVAQGKVLIIDNELHKQTLANRLPKVAHAMNVDRRDWGQSIRTRCIRGCNADIHAFGQLFEHYKPGELKLIIVDSFYRTLPPGTDENDNGAMMQVYNAIDAYAARLNAAFVLIHHTSKGSQAGKAITDVGSGAGSMSRAADTHLVLRPHSDGVIVMDAVVRSWKPVDPHPLRLNFPMWSIAEDLAASFTPAEVARQKEQQKIKKLEEQQNQDRKKIIDAMKKFPEGETQTALGKLTGMSGERAGRVILELIADGLIETTERKKHTRLEKFYRYKR